MQKLVHQAGKAEYWQLGQKLTQTYRKEKEYFQVNCKTTQSRKQILEFSMFNLSRIGIQAWWYR